MTRICRRDMDTPEITHCRTVTMLCFGEKPLFTVEFGAARSWRAERQRRRAGPVLRHERAGADAFVRRHGHGAARRRGRPDGGQADGTAAARRVRSGERARLVNVALGLKGAEQEAGGDAGSADGGPVHRAGRAVQSGRRTELSGARRRAADAGRCKPAHGVCWTVWWDGARRLRWTPGDWVVLVSDGALTDGSDWLMQQLQLCAKLGHTPKQAAETVADAAARRAGAKQDDITVAVLAMGRR